MRTEQEIRDKIAVINERIRKCEMVALIPSYASHRRALEWVLNEKRKTFRGVPEEEHEITMVLK